MAYSFAGGGEKIDYGDVTEWNNLTTFSCHGWMNLDNTTTDHVLVASHQAGTSDERWELRFDDIGSDSGRTNTIKVFLETSGGWQCSCRGGYRCDYFWAMGTRRVVFFEQ